MIKNLQQQAAYTYCSIIVGITFVPKIAMTDDLGGKVVYRSLSGDKPTRKVAICWNPYRYQSQLLSNFIKGIAEFGGSEFINSLDFSKTGKSKFSKFVAPTIK